VAPVKSWAETGPYSGSSNSRPSSMPMEDAKGRRRLALPPAHGRGVGEGGPRRGPPALPLGRLLVWSFCWNGRQHGRPPLPPFRGASVRKTKASSESEMSRAPWRSTRPEGLRRQLRLHLAQGGSWIVTDEYRFRIRRDSAWTQDTSRETAPASGSSRFRSDCGMGVHLLLPYFNDLRYRNARFMTDCHRGLGCRAGGYSERSRTCPMRPFRLGKPARGAPRTASRMRRAPCGIERSAWRQTGHGSHQGDTGECPLRGEGPQASSQQSLA